jgi:hypothetical protein
MYRWTPCTWPRNSNEIASDKPGAVQILVVGYVFTLGRKDFLDMDVVPDRLTFDLIEVAGEADT